MPEEEKREETKLEKMLRERRPPAVHGCSDGPGSCVNEIVFDRPDVEKETRLALRSMEDCGRLNTPEAKRNAALAMQRAKDYVGPKVDYGKDGHPLDD